MESVSGEIITFYSYKGGVGRSMALANIASLLARKQNNDEKILMVDWDLEAPGLHQFFHGRFLNPQNEQGDLPPEQLGLIDLFYEIKTRLEKKRPKSQVSDDIFSEIDIEKYITKVNLPSLFLMPAGRFDGGIYSTRVNEFDWEDFFNRFPSVITQFAQYLRKKFKYVLIDSRTGYTDISGICTSIMPEKLVTVFTPNRQSLLGIVELIRRATNYRKQSDDLHPLMIFPLPSRIENAENTLQKEWRFGNSDIGVDGYQKQLEIILMEVYGLSECNLTGYFDEYQLQYVPRYSYGEELAVLSERLEDRLSLARSYERFSEEIVGPSDPWETKVRVQDTTNGNVIIGSGNTINVTDGEYRRSKPSKRRIEPTGRASLNPTIIVAIIGLVGVILTALISSPMVERLLFPTPTPTATPTAASSINQMIAVLLANPLEGLNPLRVNFDASSSHIEFTDGSFTNCGDSKLCSFSFTIIKDNNPLGTIDNQSGNLSYRFSSQGQYIVTVNVCYGGASICADTSVTIGVR